MPLPTSGELPLADDHDIVLCRQHVRRLAQEINFSLVDQTKFVTAASELARNAVIYGGGGRVQWQTVESGSRRGVRLSFVDQGPGIANLELAMTDGWSSGSGLGMGLTGAKRLVNEFEIESTPGSGTRVTITRWR
ncbi:MAG TPA: anti-sigma regulatory factor [Steroidobacteraceae bacterium]|jgi:serine/threonine-protein kinase RsbT|nr:anti-sigma regulatory factor [Steroidobacteraceae bacterium]